jgi:putative peptide zinc metalloprotease protein
MPTRQKLAVRCRADLRVVHTRHKHESAVVIKDPIGMKYHRMRDDEYFVLRRLDGTRTLQQMCNEYESRFAPDRVSPTQLNQLLFRFHQSGLTISDALMQGDRLTDRRRKERRDRWLQQISGILFIRFPGVDPEPLLGRLYPIVRPFLGRIGRVAAVILCAIALATFAVRWDQFTAEFPQMSSWLQLDAILILACVVGVTKVLHELGHAISCKHFGGECHQIGPMLLVFTPALYCDTSDSWMLPSRFQRAWVGLSGVAVEVVIAAAATLVWAATAPGLVHYIAMNVMLVCSVSTLLFNANPLLRYDGYYVLSDLVDVPNLAEKSRTLLSAHLSHLLLGIDEVPAEPESIVSRFWMLTYATLAAAYRWGLTILILWFVSLMLRPYGLESLGRVLCLLAATGLVVTLLRGPVRFFKNPARRRMIRMKRLVWSMVAIAATVCLACVPFRSGVSAAARIVPRNETPIYISTGGLLSSVQATPGDHVQAGEVVATLFNHDVELEYLKAKGRFELQQSIVESLARAQLDATEAASELPAAESLLDDLRRQLETRESRREGLQLRAPVTGTLIAAANRTPQPESDDSLINGQLVSWTGQPTDQENHRCYVQPGLELMTVVADERWDAELVLSQSDVQRFEPGAKVKLACEANPAKVIRGVVTDISRSNWRVDQDAQRRDDRSAVGRQQPAGTSYTVRVALDDNETATLVAGATATARVQTEPLSLFGRATRLLNGLLRFR